jgi:hypothetical protein
MGAEATLERTLVEVQIVRATTTRVVPVVVRRIVSAGCDVHGHAALCIRSRASRSDGSSDESR